MCIRDSIWWAGEDARDATWVPASAMKQCGRVLDRWDEERGVRIGSRAANMPFHLAMQATPELDELLDPTLPTPPRTFPVPLAMPDFEPSKHFPNLSHLFAPKSRRNLAPRVPQT